MGMNDLFNAQFDRAWDAGVREAWVIVKDVLSSGAELDEIKRRFMEELEMKEPQ